MIKNKYYIGQIVWTTDEKGAYSVVIQSIRGSISVVDGVKECMYLCYEHGFLAERELFSTCREAEETLKPIL